MPLLKRRAPFHHPDWYFEVKWDGFRALARIDHGRTKLISRNGNAFASFQELQQNIGASLADDSAILDGEIVCLDRKGRCYDTNWRPVVLHKPPQLIPPRWRLPEEHVKRGRELFLTLSAKRLQPSSNSAEGYNVGYQ